MPHPQKIVGFPFRFDSGHLRIQAANSLLNTAVGKNPDGVLKQSLLVDFRLSHLLHSKMSSGDVLSTHGAK